MVCNCSEPPTLRALLTCIQALQTVSCLVATPERDLDTCLPEPIDGIPPPNSEEVVLSGTPANPSPAQSPVALSIPDREVVSEKPLDTRVGPLPIDVTMSISSPPMSPDRSPMRHVPPRIHTDMSGLAPNAPGSMIDSPWPLSPLLSGTTAVDSVDGSAPNSPVDGSEPMTLAEVFNQLSVHPRTLGVPNFPSQQRVPKRLQTNNHPPLSVRFDDVATPTNQRQTLYSAIPFSPCTPKAMSFPSPWVVAQSPAGIEEAAAARPRAVSKIYKPAYEELSTPICRAYYFDTQTFPRPVGEIPNPPAYEEDAPMLALQSDSQDSVMIYDRVGERMLEVNGSGVPPWTKGVAEKDLTEARVTSEEV